MLDVLAIDPGEKAGLAHGRIDHERPNELEIVRHGIMPLWSLAECLDGVHMPIRTGLRPPPRSNSLPAPGGYAYKALDLSIGQFDVVIYETWRLDAAHAQELVGSDMQTSQLIGIIRFLARRAGVKLVSQGPKDWHVGERVAPPTVTAILGTLPKSHDASHDGPALCHLAKWWYTNYFDPTQEPA